MTQLQKANDISLISTSDLKKELSLQIEISAKSLLKMAEIYNELYARGEDMSYLKSSLAKYLPLIGEGYLLPELMVNYAHSSTLLDYLANLTREDQQSLLDDPFINVVEWLPNHTINIVKSHIADLKFYQIKCAFHYGSIQSPANQKKLIHQKEVVGHNAPSKIISRADTIYVDTKKHSIVVGNKRCQIHDIIRELNKNYGDRFLVKIIDDIEV